MNCRQWVVDVTEQAPSRYAAELFRQAIQLDSCLAPAAGRRQAARSAAFQIKNQKS
jgi:hypothetical protein